MDTISLPLMRRAAEISAQSYREADNTVDVIWTAGAVVRRRNFSWDGVKEFDEELIVSANSVRLDRLNAGAPFLDTHNQYSLSSILGAVVPGTARLAGGKGLARIQLSRAEADATVVRKIADGIIRNVSSGYRIHAIERIEQDGKVPLVRVVDWEPWEISAVAVGADPDAAIRSADDTFPCEITGAGGAKPIGRTSPVLCAVRAHIQRGLMSSRLLNH